MYCRHCGMHNEKTTGDCALCGRPLDSAYAPRDEKYGVDMTRFPLPAICASFLRANRALFPLVFPVFCVVYLVCKLTGRPLPSSVFSSPDLKLHPAALSDIRALKAKELTATEAAFAELGFEYMTDIENRGRAHAIFERMFINRRFGAYATILLSKVTGRVMYIEFTALTEGKKIITFANTDGIEEPDDPHVRTFYVPGKTIGRTWELFAEELARLNERRVCLDPGRLFPLLNKGHRYFIDLYTAKGILLKYSEASSRQLPVFCYRHPTVMAVRACASCGTPVCEACFKEVNGAHFCGTCAPADNAPASWFPRPPWGYAGAWVRSCAAVFDFIIIAAAGAAAYFSARALFSFMELGHAEAAAFVAAQPFFIGALAWNFLFLPARKGRTIGKKLWGLRVIDKKGENAPMVPTLIRLAVSMISCLFIFPLIGFLFILFRKKKTGFHDQLAGTYVITKHPRKKALLAAFVAVPALALLLCAVTFVSLHATAAFEAALAPSVRLPSRWEIVNNKSGISWNAAILDRIGGCLVTDDSSLTCVGMTKGDTLWRLRGLNYPILIYRDTAGPVVILESNGPAVSRLSKVDDRNGTLAWSRNLPGGGRHEWSVAADSLSIVAYASDCFIVYSVTGEKLMDKQIASSEKPFTVLQAGDELIVAYGSGNTARREEVFDIHGGRMVNARSAAKGRHAVPVSKRYRLEAIDGGKPALVSIPENREVWRCPDTSEYFLGFSDDTVVDRGMPLVIYGWRRAYRGVDGTVAFEYPRQTRFLCATGNYVVLSVFDDARPKAPPAAYGKGTWLFLDKTSGAIVHSVGDTTISSPYFLKENEHAWYFGAMRRDPSAHKNGSKAAFPGSLLDVSGFSSMAILVCIDKADFSVRKHELGKNIAFGRMRIFPDDLLLFIGGSDRIGGYMLPETQHVACAGRP